jgi:hypothetical protein
VDCAPDALGHVAIDGPFAVCDARHSRDRDASKECNVADVDPRVRLRPFPTLMHGPEYRALGSFDKNRHLPVSQRRWRRGRPVPWYQGLVVQPFDRHRDVSRDQRWLVILDSGTLVLRTVASVRREIDRSLAHSTTDPSLLQRLGRMRSGEDTWCILNTPARNPEIKNALAALHPKLSQLTEEADSLQFGIRYGRHIEFEYEITTAAGSIARNIFNALAQSIVGEPRMQSALLTPQNSRDNVAIEHGLVKVSRARYGRWLNDVEARMRPLMTTPLQALLSTR